MRRVIVCSGVVLPSFWFAIEQGGTTPVTLAIHSEGKKNTAAISKSDVLVFDNDAKVSSVLDVVPVITQDAAFASRR